MKKLKKNNYILNEGYDAKIIFSGGNQSKIYFKNSKLIDFSFCSGALLLGHRSKIFLKCLKDLTKNKISPLSSPNSTAVLFSKLLKKIFPHFSKFIFCTTGSEAVLKALRIARAISNEDLIISVTGSWHGSNDKTLFSTNKKMASVPLSGGLSKFDQKNIKFIPYNNLKESKKILDKYKSKIGDIIIEPIQGGLPLKNIKTYLKFLKNYSKKNKKILIFDEIITGLRCDGKSVQNLYHVEPDISLFGKSFGGGMPIGVIGISKKIENLLKNKNVYLGGTFSGNSISTYFGYATTKFIIKNKKKIFEDLENKSKYFYNKVSNYIGENNFKVQIFRFKSMLRIIFSDKIIENRIQRDFFERKNKKKMENFRNYLFEKKIYYPKNGIIFISTQHKYKDLDLSIKFFNLGLKKFFR
jgi:glutamate-1-semialdehyde 2,1-aminomutase